MADGSHIYLASPESIELKRHRQIFAYTNEESALENVRIPLDATWDCTGV